MASADLGPALYEAARLGDEHKVARLLAAGADIHATYNVGMTALHVAALEGHSGVIRTLLAAGASPFLPDDGALLPIHLTTLTGQFAAARLLLEAAPSTAAIANDAGLTALHLAAQDCSPDLVHLIWEAAPQAALMKTRQGDTPLHLAVQGRNDKVVQLLLDAAPAAALEVQNAVGLGIDGATPLYMACIRGHTTSVRHLLAAAPQAASVLAGDTVQYGPLHMAVMAGHLEIVRLILEAAPHVAQQPTSHGHLPIHLAAIATQRPSTPAILRLLLAAAPASATATDNGMFTPLQYAALGGNAAAAGLLVRWAPAGAADELEGALRKAAAAQEAVEAAAEGRLQAYLETARVLLAAVPPNASLPVLMQNADWALPLFPDVAAHWPLTAAEWTQLPAPCPGLGRALPAVLQRSEAEAGLLVAHLPAADSARLQAFALALHRAQRRMDIYLPSELVGRMLSHFAA